MSSYINENGQLTIQTKTSIFVQRDPTVFIKGDAGPPGPGGPAGTPGVDGQDGSDGIQGEAGLSAYQIAIANGFSGTESQWLTSLIGPIGPAGTPGVDGQDGSDGISPVLSIGTVTTGAPGSNASITITGPTATPSLNLTIPRGDTGLQGIPGPQGATGPAGSPDTGQQIAAKLETLAGNDRLKTSSLNNNSNFVAANVTGFFIEVLSQAQYDALSVKNSNTLYFVTP